MHGMGEKKQQSFDALAHEFDLAACSHLSSIFHRSFLSANSSSLTNLLLNLLWKVFNGLLYIPVVSLALLTEGRTARDLPKQRWSKKKASHQHMSPSIP